MILYEFLNEIRLNGENRPVPGVRTLLERAGLGAYFLLFVPLDKILERRFFRKPVWGSPHENSQSGILS